MAKKKVSSEHKIEQILTTWGIVVILWSIFRANFAPPIWFNEFLVKPLIFLLPVYFYLKKNEKKDRFLFQLGWPKKKAWREFLISLILLLFIFGIGLLVLSLSKEIQIIFLNKVNYQRLAVYIALALASAFSEELFGRGFLFNYLHKYSKNVLLALFLSSTLFFVLYLPGALSMQISGQDLFINLILNFTLSFITGIAFYLRKNILPAIAIHAGIILWFDLILGGLLF